MDNQNNNDNMNGIFNCEDCVNSDNRNPKIENEQSGIFKMNNISKETADCEYVSNQKESALTGDARNSEDNNRKTSAAENAVVSDESNMEQKNEIVKKQQDKQQINNSDSKTVLNYKGRWIDESRLYRRHVKRYLDEPSDQMVVFSSRAYNSIISETYAKDPVETGGILLGYVLDNGFWIVTEVIPPGKSSVNQYAYFEYDTEFVNYVANRVANQFKYPPQVLGLWHRHPGSMDTFSSVDDSTNATFSNNNRACGAISALVNLDPNYRITIYHVKTNEYGQVQYQKMAYEVGDEFIPEEYFQLKYVAGTSKSHAVQDANDAEAFEEATCNFSTDQEKTSNSLQNQEKNEHVLKCIHITLELILILFLAVNIAIFIQNPRVNPLTERQSAVQTMESQADQSSIVSTTNPLTDQSSIENDWASQYEEWSKVLNISNEGPQVSLHNDIGLSQLDSSRDQISLDDNNSQKNRHFYDAGVFDDSDVDVTLENEGNDVIQLYRNGYGAYDSEASSDRSISPLNHEKTQSEPDVNKQNLESGLPNKTAAIPREILE